MRMVTSPVVGANGYVQINLAVVSASSTTIDLSSSDPAIMVPANVTIPSGSVSLTVPFQIGSSFDSRHVFAIQGQFGSETETVYGTQGMPSTGFRLFIVWNQETVAAGGTTRDYQLVIYSNEGYGTTVDLQCRGLPAGATCQFGDSTLQLPKGGGAFTPLKIATSAAVAPGTYPFTVVATDGTFSAQISATVQIVSGPVMQFSPTFLSFGVQQVGTTP